MAVPTWIRRTLSRLFITKQRRLRDADRRGMKLQVEVLEDRVVPTNLYVGTLAQFGLASAPSTGTAVTWTPGANFAGFTAQSALFNQTAFTDIQAALNSAASGDTIEVAPGSYTGDYNINTSVTLEGANSGGTAAGVLANYVATPANTTVITSPTAAGSGGVYNDIFRIGASNVAISGFVLEGSGHGDDGITNFAAATGNTVQVNNISLQQNIIQDFTGSGIYLDNAGAAQGVPDPSSASTGNVISTNYVANNGNIAANYDQPGIGLFDNFFATVIGNSIVVPTNTTGSAVVEGITVKGFNTSGVGPEALTLAGNDITVGQNSAGIFVNLVSQSAITVTVSNNSIQAASGVVETATGNTWGMSIKSISDSAVVSESGDTIGTTGGQFSQGINVWNTGTNNVTLDPTQIGGGTASSPVIGVNLSAVDPVYGPSSAANSVPVSGAITGASIGLEASGVVDLSVSNAQLSGPAALSGTGLTGTASLTGVSVHGSGTSSLGFSGRTSTLNVSAMPDAVPAGQNAVSITGSTLQYNSDETINYSGLMNLNVTGNDGPDAFVVTPSPMGATIITVNGNTPNASPVVDTLSLVETGLFTPVIHNTSTAANPGSGFLTSNSFSVNNPAVFWTRISEAGAATAPAFTSPNNYTYIDNATPGTFQATASGDPAPTFGVTGGLPAGVTFNSAGLLTVAGTTVPGYYTFTLTATNAVGSATQAFTLHVEQLPTITTPSSTTTVVIGYAGSFTVSATGSPTPSLAFTSSPGLPPGFGFDASSGTLSWPSILASNDIGVYHVTFYATSSIGTTSQSVTLTITSLPAFTSAANASFQAGTGGTFTVTTTGYPAAALVPSALPAGVTFSDNGNGTGTLTVSPAAAAGSFPITFTATNLATTAVPPPITQNFTLNLTASLAPTITSTNSYTVTAGGAPFTVTATGTPAPTFSHTGVIPAGANLNSAGVLTVAPSTAPGVYTFSITATNGVSPSAAQTFTLTVLSPITVTGAPQAVVGTAGSISVSAVGTPTPSLFLTSNPGLPSGFSFNAGSGLLSWPAGLSTGSTGVYTLTIYATNSHGTSSKQVVFGVERPGGPSITSANSLTVTHLGGGSFTVVGTAGSTLSVASATPLPAGATFTPGTGVLNLPANAVAVGTYSLTFVATNALGSYVQPFTITVNNPQLLAGAANTNPKAPALSQAQLAPIVAAAIQRWVQAGISPIQAALLRSTSITVGNLTAAGELGDTSASGRIVIDATADGDGWFIDPNPLSNKAFTGARGSKQLTATTGPAATEVDLLTVVMHEMGHILGLPDLDPSLYPNQLMTATLSVGVRRLP